MRHRWECVRVCECGFILANKLWYRVKVAMWELIFFDKLLRISQSGRDLVRARISIIEKYVGVGESGLILG